MPTQLCGECYLLGFCRRLQSRVVTNAELTPEFIADMRRFMRGLGLSRDGWKMFLIDAYQDYPGRVVDAQGNEVMLDTGVYDLASLRYWFRDLCRVIAPGTRVRLRQRARERFRVTASILRALYPVEAMLWGKEIANDDERALPAPVKVAGCPYGHFHIGDGNK